MKALALDLGDTWTGTALSDALKIIATPHKTVKTVELIAFLKNITQTEQIDTIVIGYPRTMRDTESLQTKKVVEQKEFIEKQFPNQKCILWDERLTSKVAKSIKPNKSKNDSTHEHSIAAALILETYLQFLT